MHQNIIDLFRINKDIITREIADIEEIILIAEKYTTSDNEKLKAIVNKLKKELEEIEEQQKAFNEKMQNITDPELKEMAIAYFIDKQSCEEIGKKYYLERTTVYKKLKRYFDN